MRHFGYSRTGPATVDLDGPNSEASPNGMGERKMLKFGLYTSKSRY